MTKSKVQFYITAQALLLRYPQIVDAYQQKNHRYLVLLQAWMVDAEKALQEAGFAQCAQLAGYRSKLTIPVINGQRASRRRQQAQVAAEILYDVQQVLLDVFQPIEQRLNTCRDIFNQLLIAIQQTADLHYDKREGYQQLIDRLWELIRQHEQLKPNLARILMLISQADAKWLLADTLRLDEWPTG